MGFHFVYGLHAVVRRWHRFGRGADVLQRMLG